MYRRAISIALYFCATVLSILFVVQLSGGFFPAIQVQYWPVALAGLYLASAFLLPESVPAGLPQSRFCLRCMGLFVFFLSPFLSWAAYLSSYGVGFVPIDRHIYLQLAGIADLFCVVLFLSLYGEALLKTYGVKLRFLGRKMLQAPIWFLLAPAFAVLAGILFLSLTGEGDERLPMRLIPNVLWTILFRDPGAGICAGMFGLSFGLHALGVNCVICAKRPRSPEPLPVETDVSDVILSTIQEGGVPVEQEEITDDKTDKID